MTNKKFKIPAEQLKQLITPMGACVATDKITVEGMPIGYMYREEPEFEQDSGWRFFSGTEDQEYADDANNSMFYDVNTIANYDRSIIPYLLLPIGTELEKVKQDNTFKISTP
jgi:hypothetical protein